MKRSAFAFMLFGALTVSAQEYTSERPPILLSKCTPRYPEGAKRERIEGTVVLAIEVHPDGMAHSISVRRSLGSGLDESAIEAVKQWRFKPGEKHGEPVVMRATIQVNFRLDDPSTPFCVALPANSEEKQ
jgi:TonB family protein